MRFLFSFPKLVLIGILALAFTQCSESKKTKARAYFFPTLNKKKDLISTIGQINQVVVVAEPDFKKSLAEEVLLHFQDQSFPGLSFHEPQFSTLSVKPARFKGLFEQNRNVIFLNIGEKNSLKIEKDKYAAPQVFMNITAKDYGQMASVLKKYGETILRQIHENDLRTVINAIKTQKALNKTMLGKAPYGMKIPAYYLEAENKPNFIWYRHLMSKDRSLNLWISKLPKDSISEPMDIIKWRDRFTKENIQGTAPNSYMTTDLRFEPEFSSYTRKKHKIIQTRGTWRLENDFMGGSFVSITVIHQNKKDAWHFEGFVYSPMHDKRVSMKRLEGILKTIWIK